MLVACGLVMFAMTLKRPPYFGGGGSVEPEAVALSTANRLRCAVDTATLWVYLCSLAAVFADGSTGAFLPLLPQRRCNFCILRTVC